MEMLKLEDRVVYNSKVFGTGLGVITDIHHLGDRKIYIVKADNGSSLKLRESQLKPVEKEDDTFNKDDFDSAVEKTREAFLGAINENYIEEAVTFSNMFVDMLRFTLFGEVDNE